MICVTLLWSVSLCHDVCHTMSWSVSHCVVICVNVLWPASYYVMISVSLCHEQVVSHIVLCVCLCVYLCVCLFVCVCVRARVCVRREKVISLSYTMSFHLIRIYRCLGDDGACCVSSQDLFPFVWSSMFCLPVCYVVLPYTSWGLCECIMCLV